MNKAKYTQTDIEAVSDNPELTDEDIARAIPFTQAFPAMAEAMTNPRKMTARKQRRPNP